MRSLFRIVSLLLIRSGPGRWILSFVLLLLGAFSVIAGAAPTQAQSQTQSVSFLIVGFVFIALGIASLIATIRIGAMRKRAVGARKAAAERAEELKQSGQLLPIPALPQPRSDISQEDMARVEAYAQRMAALPWGDHINTSPEAVRPIFDRTVARVQGVTGDWSELGEPIDTFVGLPRPLCFVGAAEVMYRLSYLRGHTFAPNGLRQGLRFIARAQVTEPRQPDALVIRTKLLAGGATKTWLDLADATLALLKQVAPERPRLPDAEMAIHVQRREYEAAMN